MLKTEIVDAIANELLMAEKEKPYRRLQINIPNWMRIWLIRCRNG